MSNHVISFRKEARFARLDVDANLPLDKGYPCLTTCTDLTHFHTGTTKLIYARCSCGWELLVGDYIYEKDAKLEGRLQHLQHQIDAARRQDG